MLDPNITEEIERFREKLLELSNRNPLINYRKTRLKTLPIVEEQPDLIYRRLIEDNKRFKFAPCQEENTSEGRSEGTGANAIDSANNGARSESIQQADLSDLDATASEKRGEGVLQTDLSEARLETVLKHMRREANSAILETGVNYLYLALGILAWRESSDSDRVLLSPLILIPAEIERFYDNRLNRYQYAVRWREEELQNNLCLAKRLEKDFGVRLPQLDEDQSPEEFFQLVEAVVCGHEHWEVQREVFIGFFSFRKLLMYLDIDPNNWSATNALGTGSIVHQVVWGRQGEAAASLYAKDYDIDEHPHAAENVFPLDADSSQHSALIDIQEGKNLVIEGPPGTGKSQTITNAIASALHQKKNVLFVAEKLTALEVVREKLAKLGLDEFCLELHSDAASPRRVYESLRTRIEGEYRHPGRLEEIRDEIQRKQNELQSYLSATSQEVGPYKEPLYESMWRVTNLRSQGYTPLRDADFDLPHSKADLDDRVDLLSAFSASLAELSNPKTSPWWGCWLTGFNPNNPRPLTDAVAQLTEVASQADALRPELLALGGEELIRWLEGRAGETRGLSEVAAATSAAEKLGEAPDLRCLVLQDHVALARDLATAIDEWDSFYRKIKPGLLASLPEAAESCDPMLELLTEDFLSLAAEATLADLRAASETIRPLQAILQGRGFQADRCQDWQAACKRLSVVMGSGGLQKINSLGSLASSLDDTSSQLVASFGEEAAEWFEGLEDAGDLIAGMQELAKSYPKSCEPGQIAKLFGETTRNVAEHLCSSLADYRESRTQVEGRLYASVEEAGPQAESVILLLDEPLAALPSELTWKKTLLLRSKL